jgi:hypothetical protein
MFLKFSKFYTSFWIPIKKQHYKIYVGFSVLTAVVMKISSAAWYIMGSTPKMETFFFSEMSVGLHTITWWYISEDGTLQYEICPLQSILLLHQELGSRVCCGSSSLVLPSFSWSSMVSYSKKLIIHRLSRNHIFDHTLYSYVGFQFLSVLINNAI